MYPLQDPIYVENTGRQKEPTEVTLEEDGGRLEGTMGKVSRVHIMSSLVIWVLMT